MKVLVTGAKGFLGEYLCQELKNLGHEVKHFRGDIKSFGDCKKNVKGNQAIYHLAAVLDESRKKELLEVNVKGTANIVEASLKESVEHFVFASSVSAMGNFGGRGTEETPLKPVTVYGRSKAEAEKIVWESQEMLPITILRPALVLGPNEYWKKVVGLIEKGFPLVGNGKNMFQMVYVKDVASAMSFVLGKGECIGEIFIVAEENAKTLEEVYMLFQQELGKPGGIKKAPGWAGVLIAHLFSLKARVGGKTSFLTPELVGRITKNRHYSIEKIKGIGWKPKYTTEQAVRETVKEILAEKFVE